MQKKGINFYIRLVVMIGAVILLARGMRSILPRLNASPAEDSPETTQSGSPAPTISSNLDQTYHGLIAFQSIQDGNLEIYTMEANGSNRINLTHQSASDHDPAWSPDGKQIAFISDRTGSSEIFVLSSNGEGLLQLTQDSGIKWFPPLTWSPDGKIITAAGSLDGNELHAQIYLIRKDGIGSQPLKASFQGAYPRWSPDGKWIAWRAFDNGDPALFIKAVDGGQEQRISVSPENQDRYGVMKDDFAWSPDSTKIAYLAIGPLVGKAPNFQFPFQARARIQVYDMAASTTQTLLDIGLPNNIHFLRWSPDGKLLMYVQEIGMSGCWTVRFQPLDASTASNATGVCFTPEAAAPDWIPNSQWLLLTGSKYQGDPNTAIFALNALQALENPDSPVISQITSSNGQDTNPQVQP